MQGFVQDHAFSTLKMI